MESEKGHDEGVTALPSVDETPKKKENEKPKKSKPPSPEPYMPSLSFPQRFDKAKLDSQFTKLICLRSSIRTFL